MAINLLSQTALYGRKNKFEIYKNLKMDLNLFGFELSFHGDNNELKYSTAGHDNFLRHPDNEKRILKVQDPEDLKLYLDFFKNNYLKLWSIHFPKKSYDINKYFDILNTIYDELKIDVCVENGYDLKNHQLSDPDDIYKYLNLNQNIKLCLDVSHLKIIFNGDETKIVDCYESFRKDGFITELHISDNDGKRDQHHMIPTDSYIYSLNLEGVKYKTFESLPIKYKKFNRVDYKLF